MSRGSALRRCYHLGVTVGRHEEAARLSRDDMLAFLKAVLQVERVAGNTRSTPLSSVSFSDSP
jgi:hypothetical protein